MAHSSRLSLLASALLVVALVIDIPDTTAAFVSTNVLLQNQALFAGDYLVLSPYQFLMQRDCNLVLYNENNPLWASNSSTTIFESCYFLLQPDGNGVIYDSWQNAVFATDTWGRNDGSHTITLQSDGNVVMTNAQGDAIWQTYTSGR